MTQNGWGNSGKKLEVEGRWKRVWGACRSDMTNMGYTYLRQNYRFDY